MFDPHGYDQTDYYDAIEADMKNRDAIEADMKKKREMERKEQERKKTPKELFNFQNRQLIPNLTNTTKRDLTN